jgi:alpha-amylase/alpha-mannosidase (GH57 family)
MAHVVFLWHMHQPYYVDPVSRVAQMPWVRLHAVKGYLDMAAMAERHSSVRLNFNMTPVLVKQIRELASGAVADLWLEWTRMPAAALGEVEKAQILENFFKIHIGNLLMPYPRYAELYARRGERLPVEGARGVVQRFGVQDMLDLQVWFNLAWCGFTAFRMYPELEELRRKGSGFTEEEKLRVIAVHEDILRRVLPMYARLEAEGLAEITTTPFYHPIMPLVCDSDSALRAMPGRAMPRRFAWPEDARAHLELAVRQHEEVFGRRPRGLWPSEGSVSPEIIPLVRDVGIEYLCTDEENLFHSLRAEGLSTRREELFCGWRIESGGASVNALFREKPLSDFIGFSAARNTPESGAGHLLHHLGEIARVTDSGSVVPLILDGENAWETFADGGEAFLECLYRGVAERAGVLESVTAAEYFQKCPPRGTLRRLHSGSWICSNFDIWIGEEEENTAWERLGEVRAYFENRRGALSDDVVAAALDEIYAAEGSDWFWWYGPDFSTENDALFDELFRRHLQNVYRICGDEPPEVLFRPISRRVLGVPYQQPRRWISPELRGGLGVMGWVGAGEYRAGLEQGAMYRGDRVLQRVLFGMDADRFYVRMEGGFGRSGLSVEVVVEVGGERRVFARGRGMRDGDEEQREDPGVRWVWARAVEFSVLLREVVTDGEVRFFVRVLASGVESDRACEQGMMVMKVLDGGTLHSEWLA